MDLIFTNEPPRRSAAGRFILNSVLFSMQILYDKKFPFFVIMKARQTQEHMIEWYMTCVCSHIYNLEGFMIKPKYERQRNDQLVATNAGIVLAEIRGYYPTESLKTMAARIGRSESALLRWQRPTGRARYKDMEALIAAYPEPEQNNQNEIVPVQKIPVEMVTELFFLVDKAKAIADGLRVQFGVQTRRA
jgi:hypothetical protein